MISRRNLLPVLAGVLMTACASAPTSMPAPAPAAPTITRDAATATAIEAALAGVHRSATNRARDRQQHPLDTLLFFGIKPTMTVVEVWPGAGAWYTEVLAPLLSNGQLNVAMPAAAPGNEYLVGLRKDFHDKLAAHPEVYGKVRVSQLGKDHFEIATPGSADLVLTFGNLHNWMELGMAPEAIAAIHAVLKPGGVFGIVEHRADPAKPVDARAMNGYVNETHAIQLIEAAGFELLERSEINANPRDTKDYEQGVWALPPSYRAGNRDRAKYEAIGESDRFTVKFRKR